VIPHREEGCFRGEDPILVADENGEGVLQ
jgi:hypothetical protein